MMKGRYIAIGVIVLIMIAYVVWITRSNKAKSLDCLSNTCKSGNGTILPISECTKIGLIC